MFGIRKSKLLKIGSVIISLNEIVHAWGHDNSVSIIYKNRNEPISLDFESPESAKIFFEKIWEALRELSES